MAAVATKRNVLLLSLLLALITSGLIYKFLRDQSRKKVVEKVPVVVATTEIGAKQVIREGQVTVRYVAGDEIHGEVCSSTTDVVGRVALLKIDPNTLVSPADIGEASVKLGLAYVIPPFMRAITVGIDDVSGVAGFLKPRDHVDVIGSFESNDRSVAKTVLQDVELLALGSDVQQEKVNPDSGRPVQDRKTTATLLVTPKDAEKLVLADTQGKLRLVLRSPGDVVKVQTSGAQETQVSGIAPRQTVTASAAPAAAPVRSEYPVQRLRPDPGFFSAPRVSPIAAPKPASVPPTVIQIPKQTKKEIVVFKGGSRTTVEVDDSENTKEGGVGN